MALSILRSARKASRLPLHSALRSRNVAIPALRCYSAVAQDPMTGELTALPNIEVRIQKLFELKFTTYEVITQPARLKFIQNTNPRPPPPASQLVFGKIFVCSSVENL